MVSLPRESSEATFYDCVIVGSGIAGLYTALLLHSPLSLLLVTKGKIDDCNTLHAQGGIAAAIGSDDSPKFHIEDTIAGGAGLCDEEVVRIMAEEAADRIADLVMLGVPFDTINGEISLGLEAFHSRHRILHAGGDATGMNIELTLAEKVRQLALPVRENFLVTEIKTKAGVASSIRGIDLTTDEVVEIGFKFLILATGGAGQLFKVTTNPEVATGDGVALAFSAGAEITDMEFFQFHPTAFSLPGAPPFLISEAVRGEGAVLRNIRGHRFMPDYHPSADLAPRDIVARAIKTEMEKASTDHVFLDATSLSRPRLISRFPQIHEFCQEYGMDLSKDLLPVAPAAHYMIGGIRVNTFGESSLPGLLAVGEVACSGVHGANRLASNSLLEVLVTAKRLAKKIIDDLPYDVASRRPNDIYFTLPSRPDGFSWKPCCEELKELMWSKVAIVRDGEGLPQATRQLASWQESLGQAAGHLDYEIRNMVLVGRLIAEAALIREESRGAHYRSDFPSTEPIWQRHIVFTS